MFWRACGHLSISLSLVIDLPYPTDPTKSHKTQLILQPISPWESCIPCAGRGNLGPQLDSLVPWNFKNGRRCWKIPVDWLNLTPRPKLFFSVAEIYKLTIKSQKWPSGIKFGWKAPCSVLAKKASLPLEHKIHRSSSCRAWGLGVNITASHGRTFIVAPKFVQITFCFQIQLTFSGRQIFIQLCQKKSKIQQASEPKTPGTSDDNGIYNVAWYLISYKYIMVQFKHKAGIKAKFAQRPGINQGGAPTQNCLMNWLRRPAGCSESQNMSKSCSTSWKSHSWQPTLDVLTWHCQVFVENVVRHVMGGWWNKHPTACWENSNETSWHCERSRKHPKTIKTPLRINPRRTPHWQLTKHGPILGHVCPVSDRPGWYLRAPIPCSSSILWNSLASNKAVAKTRL